jgi:hypothetical protein
MMHHVAEVAVFVDDQLDQPGESGVVHAVKQAQVFEQLSEGVVVACAEVLAVAGAVHIEAKEAEKTREASQQDALAFAGPHLIQDTPIIIDERRKGRLTPE